MRLRVALDLKLSDFSVTLAMRVLGRVLSTVEICLVYRLGRGWSAIMFEVADLCILLGAISCRCADDRLVLLIRQSRGTGSSECWIASGGLISVLWVCVAEWDVL